MPSWKGNLSQGAEGSPKLGDHAPQSGVLTGVSRSKGGERLEREQQERRMRAGVRQLLRKTYGN